MFIANNSAENMKEDPAVSKPFGPVLLEKGFLLEQALEKKQFYTIAQFGKI